MRISKILPWAIFLLCIAATEVFLWRAVRMLPPASADDARTMALNDAIVEGPYDVLFLGDSTVKQGVIPSHFDALVGTKSINLGVHRNAAAASDVFYLTEYLSRYPPPKAVFVLRAVHMWGTKQHDELFKEYFYLPSVVRSFYPSHPFLLEEYTESVVGLTLPSLRNVTTLRRRLLPEQSDVPASPQKEFGERGYVRDDAILADTTPVYAEPPTEQSLSLLRELCRTAHVHAIPMFIAIGPNTMENAKDVSEKISNTVAEFQYDECTFLSLEAVPPLHQADQVHVNHHGALNVTEALVKTFQQKIR